MHKVTFYPVGNGDTSQIVLANGKRILFDYCHRAAGEEEESPLLDVEKRLREELSVAKRNYFDVVAFTHGDDDHIAGSTDFFELWHAEKYQGEGRIKMPELWVPAEMILETAANHEQEKEFVILRQEARYRLKLGKGIQVFSRPDKLKEWLASQGIKLEDRLHLITDAGKLAKGFALDSDGVEFFCHSPFVKHVDDSDDMRNEGALIFQVRFVVEGVQTNYLAVGDSTWDVLEDIVNITKFHKRIDRLHWDLFNIPHHCSYRALADEKGDEETIPTDTVKELLRLGQRGSYLVSSSNPIPDSKEMYGAIQPPHIQARKAYERYLREVGGRKFLVTMEEPRASKPEPLEFEITGRGMRFLGSAIVGAAAVITSSPPRAG